jgi:8-amino-7-oxononanoate synthase
MFEERFSKKLELQRQANLYREPPRITRREGQYIFAGSQKILSFASNDYLGLSLSKNLRQKVAENFLKYGASASSSRLVAGNYDMINKAEKIYAQYFGSENALFFPSGYQANVGILSTFFEHDDTVIFDKHIHASSVKGLALSGAHFSGYNHNSMSHLARRLEGNKNKSVAVLTESLFSMDGDMLDVGAFGKLKKDYGFFSIVDEAHAFGVLGEKGRGIAAGVADVAVGTFGKAFGLFGAFVLLPERLKEHLFNFCSPLIYTTTLPEAHAASAIDVLEVISGSDEPRKRLNEISQWMKDELNREGFRVKGDAHILAIEIGKEAKTTSLARMLFENNIYALPARYPTVPLNKAIIRICMTALHTEEDVKAFISRLTEAYRKLDETNK